VDSLTHVSRIFSALADAKIAAHVPAVRFNKDVYGCDEGVPLDNSLVEVRFVDSKPKRNLPRGMSPEAKGENDYWFENLIPV
jgi:hypothetical protein